MRSGICFALHGPFSDVALIADLAQAAEDAGWDGCFVWDHLQFGHPDSVADPWVALTAIALATRKVRIGTVVTPLFRRQLPRLARETATLDHLSGGRLVLGVGSGTDLFGEISTFAGPMDDRVRAEMLDEGLTVLTGLWTGANFSFEGKHFRVRNARFLPAPLQSPRIPIWVAGTWPRKPPFRRAARYDGTVPVLGNLKGSLSPDQVKKLIAYVARFRSPGLPFEVVVSGSTVETSADHDRESVAPYAQAGATWWLETFVPWRYSLDEVRRRIDRGPPYR
jgi:alkanesulfonate monooxygenase SsuD/methylene tetrahydromethanopterin reductase-like flavin-dependent oxidoreductase (luciferase family)